MEQTKVAIDLSRANLVEGWMSQEEMEWLAEQATTHHMIAELGSYLGRSTRALADNTPGKVLAIDDWAGPRDVHVAGRSKLEVKFLENVADLIQLGKVVPLKTHHAAYKPPDEVTFDMVFIDGDHSYKSVHRDISTWLPAVRQGGLICGHDFSLGYPGLLDAVFELVPGAKQAGRNTTIWYWEKQ